MGSAATRNEKPTELLVIGTIHQSHLLSPGYSLFQLTALLDMAQPDALCLEITPENRDTPEKTPPAEMYIVGVKWAVDNHRPWYPIDWGPQEVLREIREARKAFSETPEGKAKIAEADARSSHVIEKLFLGSWADLQRNTPWTFNSREFDQLAKREHDLEAEIFGEGPLTSYWRCRNREMCRLIEEALSNHPGQRVVVLTGAEHKYFLDEHFSTRAGVTVVQLEDLGFAVPELPRRERDEFVLSALSLILEGPESNARPDDVDVRGLFEELDLHASGGVGSAEQLAYLRGRLLYLERRYAEALAEFVRAAADPDARLPAFNEPMYPMALIRQGNMHDLLGNRDMALSCYGKARAVLPGGHGLVAFIGHLTEIAFSRPGRTS